MNETKVTLKGKEELMAVLRAIPLEADAAVEGALKAVGDEAQRTLQESFRPGEGVPSDPGGPPHEQTGKLKRNIFSRLQLKTLGHEILLTVGVAKTAFYAFILEYGAANYKTAPMGFKRRHRKGQGEEASRRFGKRLLPRPWFWRGMEKFYRRAPEATEQAVRAVVSKYAR